MEVLLRLAGISSDPMTIEQLARIAEDGLFISEKKFLEQAMRELDGRLDLTKPVASKIIWARL